MKNKRILQAFRLNPSIVKLIDKYAEKNKSSRTQVVEQALIEFFKNKNEDIF